MVFAGHLVGNGQRKPIPGKVAAIEHWEKPKTVSELRAYLGFCNYYSGYIKMYAEYAAPMTTMLKGNREETKKRVSRAVSVLAPEGAESDKHLFPKSCLQDDWTDDYAKSEAFAAEYRAVTDPDDGQKWPKGLTEEDGKLYRNGKLLVPESRVLELCEAWHHHMLHPGVKKQALDMQRRFEIDHMVLYTAIKKVRKGCSVCQTCNPDNRNVKGEAQWTPVPDQPMESVAMDVFSMPEVHIGKETFDCVVLCVDRHSGYVVAVPARKKGLLAKEVAVMMIRHWLTVFDIPRTICSDRGPQFTGGWFKAMCSLMGIRHAKSVAYLRRSSGRAEVAGRQLFDVCHCHCGGDRSSRHPVRLVWVNGSFGCRTIAARTRDLILDTIFAVTRPYSTVPILLWDLTA